MSSTPKAAPKAAPPAPAPKAANGKAPAPAPAPAPAQSTTNGAARSFSLSSGLIGGPRRVVVYGPGGIGKSTLAASAPCPVFIDIEDGTRNLDVNRIEGVNTFGDLRDCLHSNALDGFETIVIDSGTKAEEWAVAHTIANVPHEKGHRVTSIEGYGFGKGYQHVYDMFLLLLADCDDKIRSGQNIVLVAHDCVADVPNPVGDDYIRYEPHFQAPKSGKASIRNRVVQWADYVLFLGYDVIAEDGKGKGGGTRTIFTVERPDHIAKSRTNVQTRAFDSPTDASIWGEICSNGGQS